MSLFCVLQDAEESSLADSNQQEHNDACTEDPEDPLGTEPSTNGNRVYLDLLPVRSFLHTSCGHKSPTLKHDPCTQVSAEEVEEPSAEIKEVNMRVTMGHHIGSVYLS